MSIYGTECEFWLQGEDGKPVEVDVQVVPAWVDFECTYLPPPRRGIDEDEGYTHPRAVVFCAPWTTKGDEGKGGQEYSNALLTLSGEEYERMPWRELMAKLVDAIRQHQP